MSLSDSSSCIVLRPAGSRHALGFFLFSWFHLCSRVVGASDLARGAAASFPSFAPDSQGDRRCVTSSIPATAVKWRWCQLGAAGRLADRKCYIKLRWWSEVWEMKRVTGCFVDFPHLGRCWIPALLQMLWPVAPKKWWAIVDIRYYSISIKWAGEELYLKKSLWYCCHHSTCQAGWAFVAPGVKQATNDSSCDKEALLLLWGVLTI